MTFPICYQRHQLLNINSFINTMASIKFIWGTFQVLAGLATAVLAHPPSACTCRGAGRGGVDLGEARVEEHAAPDQYF